MFKVQIQLLIFKGEKKWQLKTQETEHSQKPYFPTNFIMKSINSTKKNLTKITIIFGQIQSNCKTQNYVLPFHLHKPTHLSKEYKNQEWCIKDCLTYTKRIRSFTARFVGRTRGSSASDMIRTITNGLKAHVGHVCCPRTWTV